MINALGFAENCYEWGETSFFLNPHLQDSYAFARIFNRCIYVVVVSAVIAPAGCLYHLFKAIQCKVEGRNVASNKHFFTAIRDAIACVRGAILPIISLALIYFKAPLLVSTLERDSLSETIIVLSSVAFGVIGFSYSYPLHGAIKGLENVRFQVVGDQIYLTHQINDFIDRVRAHDWRYPLEFVF